MKDTQKHRLYDELLKAALCEQDETEASEMLTEDELRAQGIRPHTFSPEFERRMKTLLRSTRRREWRAAHDISIKRTAIAAALCLVIGGLTVSQVDAFRIPIHGFFMALGEKFSVIQMNDETAPSPLSEEMTPYLPTYVPAGFVVTGVQEDADGFDVQYENENGLFYGISFRLVAKNAAIDTEDSSMTKITIQGHKAFIVSKDDRVTIVWMPNGRMYNLTGYIPEDDAMQILGSAKFFL